MGYGGIIKVYGVDPQQPDNFVGDLETGEIINQFWRRVFPSLSIFDASPDTTQFAAVIGFLQN